MYCVLSRDEYLTMTGDRVQQHSGREGESAGPEAGRADMSPVKSTASVVLQAAQRSVTPTWAKNPVSNQYNQVTKTVNTPSDYFRITTVLHAPPITTKLYRLIGLNNILGNNP